MGMNTNKKIGGSKSVTVRVGPLSRAILAEIGKRRMAECPGVVWSDTLLVAVLCQVGIEMACGKEGDLRPPPALIL